MRRTRARHGGRSVASGATTPNRNGLVMPGLLSEGQLSGRILRAPGGPVELDRHTARGGPGFDQFERPVPAGVREQPRALADDHGEGEQVDLVDELVLESRRMNFQPTWRTWNSRVAARRRAPRRAGSSSVTADIRDGRGALSRRCRMVRCPLFL